MANKCVKLILILVLVAAAAIGVSFLPFSLSEKFRSVANKVSEHLRGLANFGSAEPAKLHLDLAKRDSYKVGELNIVLDKADNDPKEGFVKFVQKGENDVPLDVEKFSLGEAALDGVEPALVDYCAGYFKGDFPNLLVLELGLHHRDSTPDTAASEPAGEKGAANNEAQKPAEPEKKPVKVFYAPGENNKWVKLEGEVNLAAKVETVFASLNTPAPAAANAAAAAAAPAAETEVVEDNDDDEVEVVELSGEELERLLKSVPGAAEAAAEAEAQSTARAKAAEAQAADAESQPAGAAASGLAANVEAAKTEPTPLAGPSGPEAQSPPSKTQEPTTSLESSSPNTVDGAATRAQASSASVSTGNTESTAAGSNSLRGTNGETSTQGMGQTPGVTNEGQVSQISDSTASNGSGDGAGSGGNSSSGGSSGSSTTS